MPKTKEKTPKKTTSTRGRGRPPKNVIGGKSTEKKGRGRPPKNVIQPRKSKTIETVKSANKTKKTTNKKVTKKITKSKIKNTKPFSAHKIDKKDKGSTFALLLLIFSFLLFLFSVYQAFYKEKQTIPQQVTTIKTGTISIKKHPKKNIITIDKYENIINQKVLKNNTGKTISFSGSNLTGLNITGSGHYNTGPQIQTGQNKTETIKIENFYFSKPFSIGEKGKGIHILQQLLAQEQVFSGEINDIYDRQTIEAVYQLQKKYKIITPTTPQSAYGYLGPSTRNILNKLISQYTK